MPSPCRVELMTRSKSSWRDTEATFALSPTGTSAARARACSASPVARVDCSESRRVPFTSTAACRAKFTYASLRIVFDACRCRHLAIPPILKWATFTRPADR